ncbi:ABC transporter permease [Dactylosporangium sp. CA-092794]|uniref:ABC transporter permease n=1 Tax=Dactylosporangium sp. CA-092794 TaxID=3239929 RepID=UPI003D9422F1
MNTERVSSALADEALADPLMADPTLAPAAARRPSMFTSAVPEYLRLAVTPIGLAVVLLLLWWWVGGSDLDSIERRTLNASYVRTAVGQHLLLTFTAALLVVLIAMPLGVALTRPRARRFTPLVLGLANAGQAVPAIGLLVLLTIRFGVGFRIAIIGLVASSVLPVLRNTIAGVQQVDPALVEAARGMGLRPMQVLWRVELPLAIPVMLAGLRTALVLCVGVATLATFVNAGGLGDMIINGLKLQRTTVQVTGGLLTCAIAFFVDWLGNVAERILRPRGL